jgi:hypothetical protein
MVVDQEEDMLLKNHDFSGNISKTIQVIMYQLLFLFGV